METATARPEVATRFANILFATDFSDAAAHAVPYVAAVAKHYQSRLTALHVRPPVVNPMTQPSTWAVDIEFAVSIDEKNRREMQEIFSEIPTEAIVETGDILSCINDVIQKNDIDLLVIGTRGRTGIGKLLLGSVAEEIFRNVLCPVLTVGPHAEKIPGTRTQFREILYATDFSPESQPAAAHALSLAQEFGSRLTLLHVFPQFSPKDVVFWTELQEYSKELLRRLVPQKMQASLKLEYFAEQGGPAERILALADSRQADLIVLGTQLPTGVPGAATHLPIAVAHKVVSHAPCPVLTVRHRAA